VSEGDSWLLKTLGDLQGQWASAEANQLEFSLLSLTASDKSNVEEEQNMQRAREDWGPFIAYMVKLHAQKGDLKPKMLG
jgi:hypothetical protein